MSPRRRFSDRIGATQPRIAIQREDIDARLRHKLWSGVHLALANHTESRWYELEVYHKFERDIAIQRLWIETFGQPVDSAPGSWGAFLEHVKAALLQGKWTQAYNVLEDLLQELPPPLAEPLTMITNKYLEDEVSAYRIVNGELTPITTEAEIGAIEAGLTDTAGLPLVREHLAAALTMFSDRENPDYRNSAKEAISALELLCQVITGAPKATLGQAVKRLGDAGITVHPALQGTISQLYGYASDASGIRHALKEQPAVSAADAQLVLVTCSALVSYLLQRAADAKIALT